MKIDVNNALTIILGLIAVIGAIYRLAQVESNIIAKINGLEKKLDIHLTEYQARKEHYDYLLNDLNNRLQHQANRVKDWIDQIVAHLHEKAGFIIRDRKL
ncbi:MAG: hypothetical protein KME52_15535 [Desmonostoc geniculatum HA4340-LM1]|jgi:protein associated with RNAse G/E|nr:hypothetical protein [Desmonostoc geniculatum HA4340-LM1]